MHAGRQNAFRLPRAPKKKRLLRVTIRISESEAHARGGEKKISKMGNRSCGGKNSVDFERGGVLIFPKGGHGVERISGTFRGTRKTITL